MPLEESVSNQKRNVPPERYPIIIMASPAVPLIKQFAQDSGVKVRQYGYAETVSKV